MEFYSPQDIKNKLFSRLDNTNNIYSTMNKNGNRDNVEVISAIYIKYYIDFSTAIETLNRNIVNIKYSNDKFICLYTKVNDDGKSYFIDSKLEELLICPKQNIIVANIRDFFNEHLIIINDDYYKRVSEEKNIFEYESFVDCYKSLRTIRNKVAHGLFLYNVKFDNDTLFKFMICFYVIFNYYLDIYGDGC